MNHIKAVSSLVEMMAELYPANTSVAISDENKFLFYLPSENINLRIKPGDAIKEGTLTHKALSIKQRIAEHMDSELFGVSYYGMSAPILENDRPAGAITLILPSRSPKPAHSFLTLKIDDCWFPVQHHEIMYLESQHRKTKIQSERGEGIHKLNLTQLEWMLPENHFIRVHRSYIVNVNYIKEIQPDYHSTFLLIMKNNEKIPVSQTYARHFRKALLF